MAWLRRIVKTLVAVGIGAALIVAALVWRRRSAKGRGETVREIAEETKQSIDEAKHEAVVEMAAARKREVVMKRRLEQAKKLPDRQQRRLELLRLYQESSE
jgi:putative intracellular protease/amidase